MLGKIIVFEKDNFIFLDDLGRIFIKKENNCQIFYNHESEIITTFDIVKSNKDQFDLLVVGTDQGSV